MTPSRTVSDNRAVPCLYGLNVPIITGQPAGCKRKTLSLPQNGLCTSWTSCRWSSSTVIEETTTKESQEQKLRADVGGEGRPTPTQDTEVTLRGLAEEEAAAGTSTEPDQDQDEGPGTRNQDRYK